MNFLSWLTASAGLLQVAVCSVGMEEVWLSGGTLWSGVWTHRNSVVSVSLWHRRRVTSADGLREWRWEEAQTAFRRLSTHWQTRNSCNIRMYIRPLLSSTHFHFTLFSFSRSFFLFILSIPLSTMDFRVWHYFRNTNSADQIVWRINNKYLVMFALNSCCSLKFLRQTLCVYY